MITVNHPLVHLPGVYFNCPAGEYHGALALSAHGVQAMHASPMIWWANSPLNPRWEDDSTKAQENGRAYHVRICEGRDAFYRNYAASLNKADYPDALVTNEDLTVSIVSAGFPKPRSNTRKPELIEMALAADPRKQIWDHIQREHAEKHAGKVLLPQDVINNTEVAAAMIEQHPEISRAFTGGAPEVSVFWTDENGIPCKARFDYLKPRLIVDLKTFTNPYSRPVEAAIYRAMANYRHHIQAAWYLEAATATAAMLGPREYAEPPADLLYDEKQFLFVFQQQGPAPVARGKLFQPGLVMDAAREEILQAKRLWLECWEKYGADTTWLDVAAIDNFDDSLFPAYAFTDY